MRLEAPDAVVFDYAAKGGARRVQRVVDADVHRMLALLKRRRGGTELLAYRNGRRWVDLRSSDINDYVKDLAGDGHSAKDFRTWHGTVLAAVALDVLGRRARSSRGRERVIVQAVREVARYLGNTPAVCRASYVDPRVLDRFREGRTISMDLAELPAEPERLLATAERRVIALLDGGASAPRRPAPGRPT